MDRDEQIAKAFHDAYERLAPDFGWTPRAETSVPWADVPAENRDLMVATARTLLEDGVIGRGNPERCRHLTCPNPAEVAVYTPFGVGNFCATHAAELEPSEAQGRAFASGEAVRREEVRAWLMEAFRHGPDDRKVAV